MMTICEIVPTELVEVAADEIQSGTIRRADPEARDQESVLRSRIFNGRAAGRIFLEDKDALTETLQAYYWPVMYPDFVERFFLLVTPKISFLTGVKIHPHLWICSN
jgi:hypothetical protein